MLSDHAPGAIVRIGALAHVVRSDEAPLPIVQVLGIGRNFAEHADEQGVERPERPLVFSNNPCSVIADGCL